MEGGKACLRVPGDRHKLSGLGLNHCILFGHVDIGHSGTDGLRTVLYF
jgi:hypothetical protein